jgi:DNA-binding transcriptional MerR regulator
MVWNMNKSEGRIWTLAELAEEAGLSPRTIRYYISRGLLDGPLVAGRGAVYSIEHVERLKTIQRLQAEGAMLAQIGRVLAGEDQGAEMTESQTWSLYPIDSDVQVWVKADLAPWRTSQIRKALSEFAKNVKREENHANDD